MVFDILQRRYEKNTPTKKAYDNHHDLKEGLYTSLFIVKLLDNISLRCHHEEIIASGERIANTYISKMSPNGLNNIEEISVDTNIQTGGLVVSFKRRK